MVLEGKNLLQYLKLIRVHQWHKNGFVLLGFFLLGDYANLDLLKNSLLAAVAFCFASSAVYVFNDFHDMEVDRQHPIKQKRPLAAGTIGVRPALLLALILLAFSFWLALSISPLTLLIIGIYIANNLIYSTFSRQVAIIDVFQIAFGFMLRIFAGTVGVGIFISEWMVITGFMLSLLIGFAKRYAELVNSPAPHSHRRVLKFYSKETLRNYVNIMAGATIVAYALYTLSPRSLEIHGSTNLIYTTPLVVFGILRFLYLLFHNSCQDDPAALFLKDKQMLATIVLWFLVYGLLIY